MIEVNEVGKRRKNMTATTTIAGSGNLIGIFVGSASATPTIKVEDSKGTIVNTFTPAGPQWYWIPTAFINGLIITISGTVDCTAIYN